MVVLIVQGMAVCLTRSDAFNLVVRPIDLFILNKQTFRYNRLQGILVSLRVQRARCLVAFQRTLVASWGKSLDGAQWDQGDKSE